MKIRIDQPVLSYNGEPIQAVKTQAVRNPDGSITPTEMKPLTFRDIFETTLDTHVQDHPLLAGESNKLYRIGMKILGSKRREEYDLTIDEIALLKKRVEVVYLTPIIHGRVGELFGDEVVKAEE